MRKGLGETHGTAAAIAMLAVVALSIMKEASDLKEERAKLGSSQ